MAKEHKAPLPGGFPNPTSDPRLGGGTPIVDSDPVGPRLTQPRASSRSNESRTLSEGALRGARSDHRLGGASNE
jgi:hypothetical protein